MIYFKYLKDCMEYRDKYYKGKNYAIRYDFERSMYYVSPF